MLLDLVDLLAEKRFSHPNMVTSTLLTDDSLRLSIHGYGWWNATPGHDDRAVMAFHGISNGSLNPAYLLDIEDDEALESFDVTPVSALDWAAPLAFALYCSQPIPDPLAVYDLVERWAERSGGVKTVQDFLHGSGRLSRFLEYARSNFFLLGQGPEGLRAPLVEELDRQGVRHQLQRASSPAEGRLFVRLTLDAWLFCEHATLEPL